MISRDAQAPLDLRLTVLVITWNQRDVLDRCLASLAPVLEGGLDEVVVVDNGSRDGTDELMRTKYAGFTYVRLDKNIGVGPARNVGIRHARGRFIMTLDNDARVLATGRLLGEEVERIFSSRSDVGVLAFRLVHPDGREQRNARRFPTVLHPLLARVSWLRRLRVAQAYYERQFYADVDTPAGEAPLEVDWVLGANQVFRRETAVEIGGYDPRMFYGHEDCEFCLRVRRLGLCVLLVGSITIEHDYHRRSTRSPLLFLRHTRAFFYMFWKDRSAWALRP